MYTLSTNLRSMQHHTIVKEKDEEIDDLKKKLQAALMGRLLE